MIDSSGSLPKYLQLRAVLLDMIEGGRLPVDALVPSERDLCRRFGVSRTTVRQAIDRLVAEGRLRRIPREGMVVARPKVRVARELVSFTEDMHALGMRPACVDLDARTIEADARLAALLGAAPGVAVHVLERLRLADGEPMAMERAHIPVSLAPDLFERRAPRGACAEVTFSTYRADRYRIHLGHGTPRRSAD